MAKPDNRLGVTRLPSLSRNTQNKGPEQGIDGHKRVKGRKRHIVVDILGMVLNCFVSAANIADIKAAVVVLEPLLEAYVRLEKVLADQAYKGKLGEVVEPVYHCVLEVTTKLGEGFVPAPYRWVVERTLSWLDKARRLCRDHEVLPENHEGAVYVVMIRLMLRRLTDNRRRWTSKAPQGA
ncbi:MAG: transposase [Leptolyngbya sp. SIO4C1]|nr:transposase [Leptolyngbya sp. SIO4C1]